MIDLIIAFVIGVLVGGYGVILIACIMSNKKD